MPNSAMTHVAGLQVQISTSLRQRCAWCGALLADYDLERTLVPVGQEGPPAMWPAGALVRADGNLMYTLDAELGDELPDDACARLDDAVTA